MAEQLPSGTVTFLFTDIEGSTRLLQDVGPRWAEFFDVHDRLMRSAMTAHRGSVVGTEGDSFFVAFAEASDGLAAALAAQQALAAYAWPDDAVVRVRMGLHTGRTLQVRGGYVGLTVHQAARICSAGHGGQVLVSQATADLVAQRLPRGAHLVALGHHRLKDLAQPQRLFRLAHPELVDVDKPVRSLDTRPHNLPEQLTSFVGRESEMSDIGAALGGSRLITLSGAGGCGKTRLALQVAADSAESYADGVWLVELAPVADPAMVVAAAMAALGLHEEPGRTMVDTLADHLRPRRVLLLLDNCEHVVAAAAALADALLRSCPALHLLATSRETLGVEGERAYRVPSLGVPTDEEAAGVGIAQHEAVRLFLDRATLARPTFHLTDANASAVAAICRRLDGIPLALELAAARVRALSVEQIAERLVDRFHLLTAGSRTALPRHQTLRAAIDWSHDLLTEPEQVLLRRLSVFAGGCSLDAAEDVCSDDRAPRVEVVDLLDRLTEKSLLLADERAGATRYRLLETIRQYAAGKLEEAGEGDDIRHRHRDWYCDLTERAEPELFGAREVEWLEMLEAEHDNLRAALELSLRDEPRSALRMAVALWRFWGVHNHYREAESWLDAALAQFDEQPADAEDLLLVARGRRSAGVMAGAQAELDRARAHFETGLRLARTHGDQRVISDVLCGLGRVSALQGRTQESRAEFDECIGLARDLGDPVRIAAATRGLAEYTRALEGDAASEPYFSDLLSLARDLGDRTYLASALVGLGNASFAKGDLEVARQRLEEGLDVTRRLRDLLRVGECVQSLSQLLFRQGDRHAARELLADHLTWARRYAGLVALRQALDVYGAAAWLDGDDDDAQAAHEEGLALAAQAGSRGGIAFPLYRLGVVAHSRGDGALARSRYSEALDAAARSGSGRVCGVLTSLGDLALVEGDLGAARERLEAGARVGRELGTAHELAGALASLGHHARLAGEPRAPVLYAEALHLASSVRAPEPVASALDGLAVLSGGERPALALLAGRVRRTIGVLDQPWGPRVPVGAAGVAPDDPERGGLDFDEVVRAGLAAADELARSA